MRISDWSSDVCSSDLIGTEAARLTGAVLEARSEGRKAPPLGGFAPAGSRPAAAPDRFAILPPGIPHDEPASPARFLLDWGSFNRCPPAATPAPAAPIRSASCRENVGP